MERHHRTVRRDGGNGLVNVFTFDPSPLMKLNGSTRNHPPMDPGARAQACQFCLSR
jgi:hypothetical protein